MERVCNFLKEAGAYYLATVEGNQPRVRPFGTVDLFEGKLYFQTGKVKAVANQLKANPNVELSAMSQDGRWIRIAAEAVLDENVEAQNKEIKEQITAIYHENKGRYGYRRITALLKANGHCINHKTVLKLMRILELKGKQRKNGKYHSYKGEVGKVAPNELKRDFQADIKTSLQLVGCLC